MAPRLGVLLLTGLLGAGKTTLLNHILCAEQEGRFAVVVNEFGAIGVDQQLIAERHDGLVEMTNGCLCCELADGFVASLERLRRGGRSLEKIVVETTGLADPGPLVKMFLADPILALNYALDGVITVIDAHHAGDHWLHSGEAQNQVAFADVLVINKCDGVAAVRLEAMETELRSENPLAPIYRALHGDVPICHLLSARPLNQRLDENPIAACGRAEPAHRHDENVMSVSLLFDAPLDRDGFLDWMGGFIESKGADLLRLKGILFFSDEPRRFVLQSVLGEVDGAFERPWRQAEKRQTRLVLIGRELDEAQLRQGIQPFLTVAAPAHSV